MAKLIAPDNKLTAVDIKAPNGSKKELKVNRDGSFTVPDGAISKKLKAEGFISANLMGASTSHLGFDCKNCGFGSWFAKCSRCGYDNE
jgi:hypothetical protein